ncbi:isoaspartyl peptidase/L-asparaginase family protein [Sphingomicrobium aestuariivivum]|uniref:isoaspartyl peptidase/L-asparaginase family protein n=1 Tax=Sphingomicrobium aestuariivivum TaxID=1582356 RepID=UPI001FD6AB4D|nr:isoaspartyl peptidase/L-asparaginase [Sphingomicrobium aestuariivivum]MCJ8191248.1 isoaspartyl peptidase/L-asparaginase [Sphingomicrobium aestuariivivum]
MSILLALGLAAAQPADQPQWSIVIHGGAGTILRENMTAEKDAEIRAALDAALAAGEEVLAAGGSSMDAVTAAITLLEDDPNFNAGRGAVFTWEGTNSLDASIMRGDTLEAGAVAGLSTTRHPILAAREVMEDSPHVLLSGEGADRFATERGIEQVDPSYFFTQERHDALIRYKARVEAEEQVSQLEVDHKFGTVGAVAMDTNGVYAAGTSTGGMTGKRWGRIGDSPIIGAGTYANAGCGVSATGTGEYFIRLAVAYNICNFISGLSGNEQIGDAAKVRGGIWESFTRRFADRAITEVGELGGSGGVIVLGPEGTPVFAFDTPGMYRGYARSNGDRVVAIYKDEE